MIVLIGALFDVVLYYLESTVNVLLPSNKHFNFHSYYNSFS